MADPFAHLRDPDAPLDEVPVEDERDDPRTTAPPAGELTAIDEDDPAVPPWLLEVPLDDAHRLPRAPYAGPLYPPDHHRGPTRSPAVVAVKRAVSRWRPDLLPWTEFDDIYNRKLEHAVKELQALAKIRPVSGVYGRPTHAALVAQRRHAKVFAWAFDAVAIRILVDVTTPKGPTRAQAEQLIRDAIVGYCRETIVHGWAWHYRQFRRMQSLNVDPARGGWSDCSEHATCARSYARHVTGLPVADPNGRYFDGIGWTGTLLDHNRHRVVGPPFEIGDLVIYGRGWSDTHHVATCYQPGTAAGSAWCSQGSEPGPFGLRLHYRGDVIAVVRPALLTT